MFRWHELTIGAEGRPLPQGQFRFAVNIGGLFHASIHYRPMESPNLMPMPLCWHAIVDVGRETAAYDVNREWDRAAAMTWVEGQILKLLAEWQSVLSDPIRIVNPLETTVSDV